MAALSVRTGTLQWSRMAMWTRAHLELRILTEPARSGELGLAPSGFYVLKAVLTRALSVGWLLRARGRLDRSGLRILFYHRVSEDRDELAVHPRRFREQMDFLASEGYTVMDVVRAVDLLVADKLPPSTVGLSFDDGYVDVAEHALPALAERGFRATVFVPTGVVDGTASISWYRRPPPILSWEEIVELDRGNTLTFEAHSVTHRNLTVLESETAREEIAGSKVALEARLGRPVTAFSYPAGFFGERESGFVKEAGYRLAVSCEPGVNLRDADAFALRRRQIDPRDTRLDFRAKVGGGHDLPPPLRAVYRRRYSAARGNPRFASSRR